MATEKAKVPIIDRIVALIDTKEVCMLIIGAIIGFISSMLAIAVQRFWDKLGKLSIFYAFSHSYGEECKSWGFERGACGTIYFCIPVRYEFQNTSNVPRIIRNLNILLYKDKKLVAEMKQIEHVKVTKRSGEKIVDEDDMYLGGDKGAYSFVVLPRSIQRQECEYMLTIDKDQSCKYEFNTIKARYYNEKNKAVIYTLRTLDCCWNDENFDSDEDWHQMKMKCNRWKLKKALRLIHRIS